MLVMVHSGLGEHLLDVSLDGLAISFALPVRGRGRGRVRGKGRVRGRVRGLG